MADMMFLILPLKATISDADENPHVKDEVLARVEGVMCHLSIPHGAGVGGHPLLGKLIKSVKKRKNILKDNL